MAEEAKKKDIPIDGGRRIVAEAAGWKGTPYMLNGPAAVKGVGGDCSGTTHKIYLGAQYPYTYQTANAFLAYALKSGFFREVSTGDQRQDGEFCSGPTIWRFIRRSRWIQVMQLRSVRTRAVKRGRKGMTCGRLPI